MKDELRGEELLYGDYSHLLGLQVTGNMQQISQTYREIKNLDKALFHGFITYILANLGYCNMTICRRWQINAKFMETEHNCSNCILSQELIQNGQVEWSDRILSSLGWVEEVNDFWDKFAVTIDDYDIIYELLEFIDVWSHNFENAKTKNRVKVIFVESFPVENFRSKQDVKKWKALAAIDPTYSNYILIRPRTFRYLRQQHEQELNDVKEILNKENVQLLSVDEFIDKFIPRENKELELKNWISIRNALLEKLLAENNILIIALEWRRMNDIEMRLRSARKAFENASNRMDFEHVVGDATYAVEALLQVLYHKHFNKVAPSSFTWEPLQNQLNEAIKDDYGDIVLSDLNFLHHWRNFKNHPQPNAFGRGPADETLSISKNIAFQVLTRSEDFYRLVKSSLNDFDIKEFGDA